MEVHHHPHTERKKFKEYFLEFLMIFLAVTLGFIAENFREHQVEKARAKQYIFSFYKDLNDDTTELSLDIAQYTSTISALKQKDSCYQQFKKNHNCNVCLLNLFGSSMGFKDLVNADETLLQLKNAGGLRLLDKDDADSILKYDKTIRIYKTIETTGLQTTQNEIRTVVYSLINHEAEQMGTADKNIPALYSVNKELVNTYFNLLDEIYGYNYQMSKRLILLKQNAVWLIEYFKKKYNFN